MTVLGIEKLDIFLPTHATITEGQTVTLSYAVPEDDDNPLQDADGNPVKAFTDREVVNNSTVDRDPADAGERGGTDIGR